MDAAADRSAFEPPPQPGLVRGFALAVAAHLLLAAALTWGLRWDREPQEVSAEAELWSALPQEAAPKEVVVPQPPAAPPPPEPEVVKAPPPPPPPPPEQVQRDAEIALEREKQKQLAEEKARRQAELERERKRREEAERREAERKREQAERREAERKREEAEKKAALAKAAAEKKRQEEAARKKREQEEERRVAQLREENLKRIQGLAGGTGSPNARGNAARASGPSDSWAGRIRARVKPNIVFSENVAGNPLAEVEVRMAPDGTITSRRLRKSSGNPAWDDAVLRALDKTEKLPPDLDGRVHSPVVLTFRPKD